MTAFSRTRTLMLAELITTTADDSNFELEWDRSLDESAVFEPAVRQMHDYARLSNLPFWCVACEASEIRVVSGTVGGLDSLPLSVWSAMRSVRGPCAEQLSENSIAYALPLSAVGTTRLVAIGCVRQSVHDVPQEFVFAAAEAGWSQLELDAWICDQPCGSRLLIEKLIEATWAQSKSQSRERELRNELFCVGEQIEHTYEEITLLHSLTGSLQLSRSSVELAELCLGRVRELTRAAGAALWFVESNGQTRYLTSGDLPFAEAELSGLCALCQHRDWSRPLVNNHVAGTPLEREIPGVRNFVLCPIGDVHRRTGWLIHCNSRGPDFGSVEASLLQSIATILGTHLQNRDLFQQNEELLMSFVRSMVSSIDAKDAYTRGHSERVALVARLVGEEMGLTQKDLEDLHLSGLLHDIGKIGVDDRILRKTEPLDSSEFEQIKQHPLIGYQILSGLRNLQHVLPGVRSHHEAFDGSGYPDGLRGQSIPLMARVLAVADSYDAMGSDRPYRKGMPLVRIETIFRDNRGPQWDPQIIAAYFRARDKIRREWSAHCLAELSVTTGDSAILRFRCSGSK